MAEKDNSFVIQQLGDAKEIFSWYKLGIPELEELEPRVGHALISQNLGEVLMIGGGNHLGALQEIFTINLQPKPTPDDTSTIVLNEHPGKQSFSPRYEFSCAKDSTDAVWIFGGADVQTTTNEIFRIDRDNVVEIVTRKNDDETTQPKGSVVIAATPCPRTQGSNSALVEWNGDQFVAVFAGGLKGNEAVSDRNLYLFNINQYTWHILNVRKDEVLTSVIPFGCQPPAVQGHVCTAIGSKILVHGGINGHTLYGGFHCVDLAKENEDLTYSWIDLDVTKPDAPKPSPRAAHGVAKIADVEKSNHQIFIFGGLGEKGPCNDLWCFDTKTELWTEILTVSTVCPEPRLDFGMCAVALTNEKDPTTLNVYLLVHGGMNPQGDLFKDAWVIKVK